MAMNRTEGFIKAFVEVYYLNAQGIEQHLMSFQLATGKVSDDAEYARVCKVKDDCQANPDLMQSYIKAAISAVEANDYHVSLKFGLMV